jgi:hypothetical protein
MNEWSVYQYFADARRKCIGRILSNAVKSERPDILANCSKSGDVGIEITDARPQMSEDDIDFQQEWLQEEVFDYFDAADHIYRAIEIKEAKRASAGWQRSDAAILLIRSFADIRPLWDHYGTAKRAEFLPNHGFTEIWVQDYELTFWKDGEVLGAAILCLHPAYWWRRKWLLALHRDPAIPFSVRNEAIE